MNLKEAKEIVDNLEDDPNYYQNDTITTTAPKIKNTKNSSDSIKQVSSRKGSHIIEKNNSSLKNYIIVILVAIIIYLIYILKNY